MVVSDWRCRGVNPAQQANCWGVAKRVTSPISANEHRCEDGTDPRELLNRLVADVVAEPQMDLTVEAPDLGVVTGNEMP